MMNLRARVAAPGGTGFFWGANSSLSRIRDDRWLAAQTGVGAPAPAAPPLGQAASCPSSFWPLLGGLVIGTLFGKSIAGAVGIGKATAETGVEQLRKYVEKRQTASERAGRSRTREVDTRLYKGKSITKLFPSGYYEIYSDIEGRFLKFDSLADAKAHVDQETLARRAPRRRSAEEADVASEGCGCQEVRGGTWASPTGRMLPRKRPGATWSPRKESKPRRPKRSRPSSEYDIEDLARFPRYR